MAALDVGVFESKPFVCVIGKEQALFTIHSAILAKQSKALDVLINGSMAEAVDGKVVFEDVEVETFRRFSQFVYTGDYTTPAFTRSPAVELSDGATPDNASASVIEPGDGRSIEQESSPEAEPDSAPIDGFGWGQVPERPKKAKKSSKGRILRQSLHDLTYDTETIRRTSATLCEIRPNSGPTEDYTVVFLSHAQLYVFAEKWDIKSLKTLALFKLHKTLTTFSLYEVRRPDVVALLGYTFDHTQDFVDTVDELRLLVTLYITCKVENLIDCPEFIELIGEGGQLVQNLFKMTIKRIC